MGDERLAQAGMSEEQLLKLGDAALRDGLVWIGRPRNATRAAARLLAEASGQARLRQSLSRVRRGRGG